MVYTPSDINSVVFNYTLGIGACICGILCLGLARSDHPNAPQEERRESIRIGFSLLAALPGVFAAVKINMRIWNYAGAAFPPVGDQLSLPMLLSLVLILATVPVNFYLVKKLTFKLLPVKLPEHKERHSL